MKQRITLLNKISLCTKAGTNYSIIKSLSMNLNLYANLKKKSNHALNIVRYIISNNFFEKVKTEDTEFITLFIS